MTHLVYVQQAVTAGLGFILQELVCENIHLTRTARLKSFFRATVVPTHNITTGCHTNDFKNFNAASCMCGNAFVHERNDNEGRDEMNKMHLHIIYDTKSSNRQGCLGHSVNMIVTDRSGPYAP